MTKTQYEKDLENAIEAIGRVHEGIGKLILAAGPKPNSSIVEVNPEYLGERPCYCSAFFE